jgi:hypothetical protein
MRRDEPADAAAEMRDWRKWAEAAGEWVGGVDEELGRLLAAVYAALLSPDAPDATSLPSSSGKAPALVGPAVRGTVRARFEYSSRLVAAERG